MELSERLGIPTMQFFPADPNFESVWGLGIGNMSESKIQSIGHPRFYSNSSKKSKNPIESMNRLWRAPRSPEIIVARRAAPFWKVNYLGCWIECKKS